jgi:hypothetical protein
MPEMKAAATAKPVGGSIERGEAKYVAKMMPLRNVMGGLLSRFMPINGAQTVTVQDGVGGTTTKRVLH